MNLSCTGKIEVHNSFGRNTTQRTRHSIIAVNGSLLYYFCQSHSPHAILPPTRSSPPLERVDLPPPVSFFARLARHARNLSYTRTQADASGRIGKTACDVRRIRGDSDGGLARVESRA